MMLSANKKRCDWVGGDSLMQVYHDEEWGIPVHDDRKLFEFLVLESAQAGLSWSTILKRRQGYRLCFDGFDYKKIACYGEADIERLMGDERIIRHRLKITSTISNAKHFLEIQKEFGSFSAYLWRFVGDRPVVYTIKKGQEMPATTPVSDALSGDLKKRGFKFVGSTICYAYMQAVGLANDHQAECFCKKTA